MSFLDIFTISPLQRPREISQNVSGPYYVRRGAGYKINICVKLYYLGRAKVFSSVATDFGSWTISVTDCISHWNDFRYRYQVLPKKSFDLENTSTMIAWSHIPEIHR